MRTDPLLALVRVAEELFPKRYPLTPAAFCDPYWETHPGRKRGEKRINFRIRFQQWGPEYEHWSPAFAGAVRAYVIIEGHKDERATNIITALRCLYKALQDRLKGREFEWHLLRTADLNAAGRIIASRTMSPTVCYAQAGIVSQFISWLKRNWIIDIAEWPNPYPDPGINAKHTRRGRAKRLNRLPTQRAVIGLAEIYQRATRPVDRLRICAIGLLLLTGFRIHELLGLKANALFFEERDGQRRYGVRYFNEKQRVKARRHAVRWLSPYAAVLARELWAEIGLLTAKARAQAHRLESSRSATTLPIAVPQKLVDRGWLYPWEHAKLLGVRGWHHTGRHYVRRLAKDRWVAAPPEAASRSAKVVPVQVTRDLLQMKRLPENVEVIRGERVLLSELLFIVPLQAFSKPIWSLVAPLRYHDIQVWLTGRPERTSQLKSGKSQLHRARPSAFERFCITEPDGRGGVRFCKIRTHMLRHWLNSLAHRAGMSAFLINVWMQRNSVRQTGDYLHDLLFAESPRSLAELARERLIAGEAWGQPADDLADVPLELRRPYLERKIRCAHRVPGGLCVEDLGRFGCNHGKACTSGRCGKHLRVPDIDPAGLERNGHQENLSSALVQIDGYSAGGGHAHPAQRRQYLEHLTVLAEAGA